MGTCLRVADFPSRRGVRNHRGRRRLHRPHARDCAEFCRRARDFAGPLLREGWTGKNNALIAGAKGARGNWLLFTDADTVHLPGSLARASAKQKENGPICLSYSPEQIVETFRRARCDAGGLRGTGGAVSAARVRDQSSGNRSRERPVHPRPPQRLRGRRRTRRSRHGNTGRCRLARLFRDAGHRVYFRYGGDAVRTRMYRNWAQLREGWTKNLALLFPHPIDTRQLG